MNRRKFISTGLFVAAAPAIIRPAKAQLLNLKFGAPVPDPPGTSIPMSLNDPRFSENTAGVAGQIVTTGSLSNKTWNENPGYADGDSALNWQGSSGAFTLSQCKFDWREGVRIAGDNGANLVVDQCFINTVGFSTDHADGIQAYAGLGGAIVNVTLTNSCLRSYSDTEAQSIYGPSAIGSGGWFWADDMRGNVTFNNVLVWGGERGVNIHVDSGTVNIDFKDVFFASSPNGSPWSGDDYLIYVPSGYPGTLNVVRWENVRAATVVDGAIVQGALLPSPG